MSHEQEAMRNPFGMDETCTNCPALVDARTSIVHGYGDVTAEFLLIKEAPSANADAAGRPLTDESPLQDILRTVGFLRDEQDNAGEPRLENAFLTHLTRCRHPDRPATKQECHNCDPFLNAEIRSINPEIIVPIGQRPLEVLAQEYTTETIENPDMQTFHARTLRGRGFELLPMVSVDELNEARMTSFIEAMEDTMGRDYRQTKGRQGR